MAGGEAASGFPALMRIMEPVTKGARAKVRTGIIVLLALSAAAAGEVPKLPQGRLRLGKLMRKELPREQSHTYSIPLQAGQYMHLILWQPGFASELRLRPPDSNEDSIRLILPGTPQGRQPLAWIAERSGEYRVELAAGKADDHGRYQLKLDELRWALPEDRQRIAMQRLFVEASGLNLKLEYQQAIVTWERALSLSRKVKDRERESAILNEIGSTFASHGRYDKAIDYYEQALPILREMHDQRGEGEILNSLGRARNETGQTEKAIADHQEALAIFREMRDRNNQAETLNGLGNAYEMLSRYDEALGYHKQALALRRALKDRLGEARALGNIGNAYTGWSQYEKAIGYYEQVLAISRELKNRLIECKALTVIAIAWYWLSQWDKTIAYHEQALAISRELENRQLEASNLSGLAWAYSKRSQYQKAIAYIEQALPIHRELKNRRSEAATLDDLAANYSYLGQHERAIAYNEQALVIDREVGDRKQESDALADLGFDYSCLHQNEKAIGYLEQALAISRAIKNRQGEGLALHSLGYVYCDMGDYRKAIDSDEQVLAIAREIKDRRTEGMALNASGNAWYRLGQPEKAAAFYEQALAVFREIKDPGYEGLALEGLMEVWKKLNKPRLAIFYGKQSVNAIQSIRSGIHDLGRDLQRSFLKDNEKPYRTLAEILIAQGRLAEAEQVLALLKEDEYFQYIRRDAGEASSFTQRTELTLDEAQYEKSYREIGDRLMAIGVEHGELLGKKTLTPEQSQRLVQLEQDLAVGNQAFEHFLGDLTQHFSAKPELSAKVVEQLREEEGFMEDLHELPAGTVAIYTLAGEDKFHAILRTPDAQKAYAYAIKAADLNRKVFEFREAVGDPKIDPRPLAQDLYQILLAPMVEDLRQAKAQTLMWSLDGALRYLPLAALYDGKQYLIEQYRVSVMTLASNTRLLGRPDPEWKAAGFGVTKAYNGAPALPSVSAELTGIIATKPGDAGVMAGEIRLDSEFTQQSLAETLRKRYAVVHISSHFRFQAGNETQSFLLLGDGGHLSLAELKTAANMFGGVQLLTLSACNTGMGDGAEVEGFGTLAQRQGAKAVIASLWPVADASTSLLMQRFYRIRESSPGMTKLEALREAQLELLRGTGAAAEVGNAPRILAYELSKEKPQAAPFRFDAKAPYAHPYFWAPFFLMGNWL